MSELLTQIKEDRLQARKIKNLLKISLLTTLLGDIETGGNQEEVTNKDVIAKIKSYLKKIDEVLAVEGLNEQAQYKANTEKAILEGYLPKMKDPATVERFIDDLVTEAGADNIGTIMKECNLTFGDKYDRGHANKYARSKL